MANSGNLNLSQKSDSVELAWHLLVAQKSNKALVVWIRPNISVKESEWSTSLVLSETSSD